MNTEERETVRTNAMNMTHGALLTLITTYTKAGLYAPLTEDDLEVKKMMDTHIEKMGDAHLMEALHIWKGLDAERLRQDPKVCYAWDKAIAEAKKRRLQP